MTLFFTPRITKQLKTAIFNEEQLEKDFQYLFKQDGGFYFHGPSGAGKTLYACRLLLYADNKFDSKWKPAFVSVPQLLEDIRSSFNPNAPQNGSSLLAYYQKEVDWLILDDIGVEKVSEWVLQTFYIIINHRYEYMKTTIFTSNYDLAGLEERFGDRRVVSRIGEMSMGREFKFQNFD